MNELFRIAEAMIDQADAAMPKVRRFDPGARAFEAFSFGDKGTALLDAVQATTLDDALAEITERHGGLDRGDRIGVREIGEGVDLMHVYAVRRSSTVTDWSRRDAFGQRQPLAWKRRLEHICTIDCRVVAGDLVDLNENPSLAERHRRLHRERQAKRPDGARMERRP